MDINTNQIASLEKEIADLRKILHAKESKLYELRKEIALQAKSSQKDDANFTRCDATNAALTKFGDQLPKWAIERYSRQILLPDIGVSGQRKLCAAKVLVVGAGGLGCPAAVYLAGAGVGQIGIVDYDTVELTNIHRQPLHAEADENVSKAESAAQSLRSINSRIKVVPYTVQLDSKNALEIASQYDVVLDCTDNVPTRYLLNDTCALTKLPLISGSALKMEGQLTIYGYRAEKNENEKDHTYIGPCYRCVFPSPPPAEAVGSCSADGVAPPVPGVIGCLQALEAIKLLVGQTHDKLVVERMLLFDGEDLTFRTVRLRGRAAGCAACSATPTVTHLIDYEVFCKAQAKEKDLDLHILPPANRISATELSLKLRGRLDSGDIQRPLLVDVRTTSEFDMCHIDGAVNAPIDSLRGERLKKLLDDIAQCSGQVIFVCRRGNDSQLAARAVLDATADQLGARVVDLEGGLHAWAQDVDKDFPVY